MSTTIALSKLYYYHDCMTMNNTQLCLWIAREKDREIGSYYYDDEWKDALISNEEWQFVTWTAEIYSFMFVLRTNPVGMRVLAGRWLELGPVIDIIVIIIEQVRMESECFPLVKQGLSRQASGQLVS